MTLLLGPILLAILFSFSMFGMLAMGPNQAERPPQPFFQDFFSGVVTLFGDAPPEGTLLVACIGSCDTGFKSEAYQLKPDGSFDQLEVDPKDETLVGHMITFHLVNPYGRISALETRPYVGVFDFYVQNLSFVDSLPLPNPTPRPIVPGPTLRPTPIAALPIAGDPGLARLPKFALATGTVVTLIGGGLVLVGRRNLGERSRRRG